MATGCESRKTQHHWYVFMVVRFTGFDGVQISVAKYFQEKYKCQLQCVKWPCLQFGSDSNPSYLPIEVKSFTCA